MRSSMPSRPVFCTPVMRPGWLELMSERGLPKCGVLLALKLSAQNCRLKPLREAEGAVDAQVEVDQAGPRN